MGVAASIQRFEFKALEYLNSKFSRVGDGPVWRAETFPWLNRLSIGTERIREELARYRDQGGCVPNILVTDPNAEAVYGRATWEMLHLYLVGRRIHQICGHFLETDALLCGVPNRCHAKFSILGSDRKAVPRHRDGFNGVLRLHLPLEVPKSGECYLEVGGIRVDWRVGEPFVFNPAFEHEVHKSSEEVRVVLIADFFRPEPAWLDHYNRLYYSRFSNRTEVESVFEKYRQLFPEEM